MTSEVVNAPRRQSRRGASFRDAGPPVALIVIFLIFATLSPQFRSIENVQNIVDAAAVLAVVTCGITFVLIVRQNEVLGLAGENGAGKSTLLKALVGLVAPDAGEIYVRGEPVKLRSVVEAADHGIGMVFQEQSLVPNLTAAENIVLGSEGAAVRRGVYRWDAMRRLAQEQLDKIGSHIDPLARTESLSFAERQMVEIAKVLRIEQRSQHPPVIILDEPTSVLESKEIETLFAQIRRLREFASVVFVSHRLDEVLDVCDRVTVLRGGESVGEVATAGAVPRELHRMMIGSTGSDDHYHENAAAPVVADQPRLSVRGLSGTSFHDIDLDVAAGEIVGIVGVHGSGREDVCRALFGAEPTTAGEIRMDGKKIELPSTRAACAAALTIADPDFLTQRSLTAAARTAAPLIVLAAGATLVVLCGGIDLSIAALASLSTVLLALWLPDLGGVATPVVILVAAAIGAVQGSAMTPRDRSHLLWRIGDLIEAHADEFAQLEALDNGKRVAAARDGDIAVSAELFRYFAGWATKMEGPSIPMSVPGREFHAYTRREPVGVVAGIVPWNFPLLMACFKIVPAITAGNTVILKPAEQTPLTALRLGELLLEAGLPAGVVNVLPGFGDTGAALVDHHGVDKVAFTGSTEVGKKIAAAASGNLKKVSLELGGKAPNIIFDDADIEAAIAGAVLGGYFNEGQCCVNGSRLYVQRGVYDRVVEGVAAAAAAIKVGDGFDPSSQMGPLVSREQHEKVLGYIRGAVEQGAVLNAGSADRVGDRGFFVQPTLITSVTEQMAVQTDEIFGPVVTAVPFQTEDEVVAAANNTVYGLAAGVWSNNIGTAHRVGRRLRAGTVWLNTWHADDVTLPRGGFKQSGWGRELGSFGLDDYTELKTVIAELR